jgi:hypothetical protein
VKAQAGHAKSLLFVDFDGVLHPNLVEFRPNVGMTLLPEAAGHQLFEHAGLLADALVTYTDVRIVLSTSWSRLGMQFACSALPASLRSRVVGSTYDPERHGRSFGSVARGYQILEEVERRGPTAWLALDDDAKDWPVEHMRHLVQTHPMHGLGAPAVYRTFLQRLEEVFGARRSTRRQGS